ncbi:RING-H2 zinc finger protein [Gossypium australe]|uniref:RING-H2 zinc finger protein n=1 Tax=Gossypium australe TaxID=47621 RepID=A0A5B6WZT0_9ROSI|nr:RING-H2 zinc finger protein [Gossypium australe]
MPQKVVISVRIVSGSYIKKLEERNSDSYPDLPARYILHSVDVWVECLPKEEFFTDEQEEYQDLNGTMELEKAMFNGWKLRCFIAVIEVYKCC